MVIKGKNPDRPCKGSGHRSWKAKKLHYLPNLEATKSMHGPIVPQGGAEKRICSVAIVNQGEPKELQTP